MASVTIESLDFPERSGPPGHLEANSLQDLRMPEQVNHGYSKEVIGGGIDDLGKHSRHRFLCFVRSHRSHFFVECMAWHWHKRTETMDDIPENDKQ